MEEGSYQITPVDIIITLCSLFLGVTFQVSPKFSLLQSEPQKGCSSAKCSTEQLTSPFPTPFVATYSSFSLSTQQKISASSNLQHCPILVTAMSKMFANPSITALALICPSKFFSTWKSDKNVLNTFRKILSRIGQLEITFQNLSEGFFSMVSKNSLMSGLNMLLLSLCVSTLSFWLHLILNLSSSTTALNSFKYSLCSNN